MRYESELTHNAEVPDKDLDEQEDKHKDTELIDVHIDAEEICIPWITPDNSPGDFALELELLTG
mgnify:CR=1 FL=1